MSCMSLSSDSTYGAFGQLESRNGPLREISFRASASAGTAPQVKANVPSDIAPR
jgi:hypothetical protein